MLRWDDGTISSLPQRASTFDQRVVSKFMRIRPKVLGSLEILIGILVFSLTIWTGFFYLLWSALTPVLTGAVTVSAARTHNMCQIRTSQFLNFFSAISSVISIPFHCVDTYGVRIIVLVVCDILIFIFSVTVASSFCECCRTKSRQVAVSYVSSAVPVTINNIVVVGQQYSPAPNYDQGSFVPSPNHNPIPSAPPPIDSTLPSAPPPNYSTLSSVPPPNYSTLSSAPPPNYSTLSSVPPPNYSTLSSAPPPNYSTLPSAPPPNYSTLPSAPPPNYSHLQSSAPPEHYKR